MLQVGKLRHGAGRRRAEAELGPNLEPGGRAARGAGQHLLLLEAFCSLLRPAADLRYQHGQEPLGCEGTARRLWTPVAA